MFSLRYYPLEQTEEEVNNLYALLSAEEKQRVSQLAFQKDRNEYIVSRGILRRLIGEKISCAPENVAFGYTANGKPYLLNGAVHFSLSHSNKYVLYAFSFDWEIGVDLEHCNPKTDIEGLAKFSFHPEERRILENCSSIEEKRRLFFSIWTKKEAFLKALGEGFGDISPTAINLASSPAYLPNHNRDFPYWKVISCELIDGYASAVAYPSEALESGLNVLYSPDSE